MGHLPNVDPLEPLITNYRKFFGDTATYIYDVGTRDGHDAKYIKDNLNGIYVCAIDASPSAVEITKFNYPDFDVISTAVSYYTGLTTFQKVTHENEEYVGCSSIYAEKLVNEEAFKGTVTEITVPVTTMKSILDGLHNTNDPVDIIKVDIEGYTYEFLIGLGDYIKKVKCFHLETEKTSTHANHKDSYFITDMMNNNGFYLADKSYEWGYNIEDQVWINKELALNNTECWNV